MESIFLFIFTKIFKPMQKIICRYATHKDIVTLNTNLGISIDIDTIEYNLDTKEVIKERFKTVNRPYADVNDCNTHYINMPEFQNKKIEPLHKVIFHTSKDASELTELLEQKITPRTKSIWFPKLEAGTYTKYRVVGGDSKLNYPMYVVSKGRAEVCYTSKYLTNMEVKHFIVVEPQDLAQYIQHNESKYCEVIVMDMSFKDTYETFDDIKDKSVGVGATRNFCWEYSISNGFTHHWVMDDNADEGFHWLYQNSKIKCRSGAFFRAIEDFVDRYDNIAISGLNYTSFCKMVDHTPPFKMNSRIYSFLLIRNDIDYRWRGRYNEDTDLSLRVLKDGWCTVQFNSMLAGKCTTQRLKGGNTDEFYAGEGTLNKSQMLVDMHPDVATLVWRFNRWHHHVDYRQFKQKLKVKEGIYLDGMSLVNNYGMKIIPTDEKATTNTKSHLEDKYDYLLDEPNVKFNEY